MAETGDIRETQQQEKLKNLKSTVRAVLISKKEGLTKNGLIADCQVFCY